MRRAFFLWQTGRAMNDLRRNRPWRSTVVSPPGGRKREVWRKLLRWIATPIGRVLTIALGILAVVEAVHQFRGPPWPTVPEVEPGPPNYSDAFQIPFTARNASLLFTVHATFQCAIYKFESGPPDRMSVELGSNYVMLPRSVSPAFLEPRAQRQIRCNMEEHVRTPPPLTAAEMRIRVTYEWKLPFGVWTSQKVSYTPMFVWHPELNPPAWLEGESIEPIVLPPPNAQATP